MGKRKEKEEPVYAVPDCKTPKRLTELEEGTGYDDLDEPLYQNLLHEDLADKIAKNTQERVTQAGSFLTSNEGDIVLGLGRTRATGIHQDKEIQEIPQRTEPPPGNSILSGSPAETLQQATVANVPSTNSPEEPGESQEEEITLLERTHMANELKEFANLCRSVGQFKGEKDDDSEAYFNKLERWFKICNWGVDKKARAIAILFDGKAARFYEGLDETTRLNYEQAKKAMTKHFIPNQSHLTKWNNINKMKMKADQSVAEFYDEIRKAATKIEGITDMNLTSIFLNGLPKRLAEKVAEQQPKDLATALEKAKIFESVQLMPSESAAVDQVHQAKQNNRNDWLKEQEEMQKEEQDENNTKKLREINAKFDKQEIFNQQTLGILGRFEAMLQNDREQTKGHTFVGQERINS